jgi:hypothetical protein
MPQAVCSSVSRTRKRRAKKSKGHNSLASANRDIASIEAILIVYSAHVTSGRRDLMVIDNG